MRHTEYGYVSPIELKVFSELDRELKQKQRRAKQHDAFSLDKNNEEAIMNLKKLKRSNGGSTDAR